MPAHADGVGAATDRWSWRFHRSLRPQAALDSAGALSEVNDAYCALLGRSREDLVGRHVSTLNHPSDDGEADRVLRAVLSGETAAAQVERTMAHADGSPVPVLVDVVAEPAQDGRPAGCSAVLHDLTTLRAAERGRAQQEEFFTALSRRATDLALVTDADGQLLYVSPAAAHVLGHQPEDFVGTTGWDLVHPDDVEQAMQAYAQVAADGGTTTFLMRVRDAAGGWHWIEATVTNLLGTAVDGLVCNLRDVTERVEAEQALKASEARYRAIADTAEEGIWAVSPDGTTLYANARTAAILGRDLEELYAVPAPSLLGEKARREMHERLQSRAERGVERYEVGYEHPDGRERRLWIAASPLTDGSGNALGSLAMVSDVTEARRAEEELRRAALHDALTGLPNRALLLDRLEHALARESGRTAVVLLDLDQFKVVNSARGHEAGDALLVAVADRLRTVVRPSDTLARVGGDEFAVVLEDVDETEAHVLAQDLLAGLAGAVEVPGGPVHVGASVGVAVSPPDSASDLLRFADAAVHHAKASGRGRVRLFRRRLAEEVERQDALAAELRLALPAGALALHHQPVVDLQSGAVTGTEALARWDSTLHGSVPPDVFVPVADLAGLGHDLDAWAVSTALRDVRALRGSGAVPATAFVAVNLSARSLGDPRLRDALLRATEESGVAPEHVLLEITESTVMEDPTAAAALLGRLRERGFRIAVDDFGTGYSSLAYVRTLPLDVIKIDRSFISGIADDQDALAVVASIVDLARAVGVGTVAEGVETEQQAALLRRLGCQEGQGWLWSTAVPVEQAGTLGWSTGFPLPAPGRPRASRRTGATVGPEHGLDRLLALHRSGASLATIAAALNREGFRTPGGLRWKHTSVANAVADAAYPGLTASGG